MTHLSVLLALQKGEQERSHQAVTALHRESQKPNLYEGLSRVYQPKDEGGDQLPPESQHVRTHAEDVLRQLAGLLRRPWDLTASRDGTNRVAAADLEVDDDHGDAVTLLRDVPATHLLWLEKQLNDLHTFVAKLPVLDPAERWDYDPALGHYRTEPVATSRTQKVLRNHVKYEATQQHPAQVEVFSEDRPVGTWTLTKFSGALPWDRQRELLDRVNRLRDATKAARERANLAQVIDVHEADVLFGFVLFGTVD